MPWCPVRDDGTSSDPKTFLYFILPPLLTSRKQDFGCQAFFEDVDAGLGTPAFQMLSWFILRVNEVRKISALLIDKSICPGVLSKDIVPLKESLSCASWKTILYSLPMSFAWRSFFFFSLKRSGYIFVLKLFLRGWAWLMACRILVPGSEMERVPPAVKAWS